MKTNYLKMARDYYADLATLLRLVVATDKKAAHINFYSAIEAVCRLILLRKKSGNKMIFIGNGASAAMASHLSTDFWKNGGIRAVAFNDIALLTAVSNDYGYQYVFEKPVEMFADKGDIMVAISSSGASENILNAVRAALKKRCNIITLTGFTKDNSLRQLGDFNFYVRASNYGPVEIVHHSICHCVLDTIAKHQRSTGNLRK